MATNPYVNKVQLADGTSVLDISDTTAVASDVASGKYFYLATGQKVQGSASGGTAAISVVDTTDTAGGTVRTITAVDISDTTAVASDVASGKYFYTADGTKTAGTASGGGGGLEYEEGTWTPTEDVADYTITFTNTHTNPPFHYEIFDATGNDVGTDASNLSVVYTNWYYAFGEPIYYNGSTARYGEIRMGYKNSATTMGNSTQNITSASETTWASSTGIRAYVNNTSRYWRTGRTYKWIAVWAPTT